MEDLAAADAEIAAGDVVPWEHVRAELRQIAAECRADIARKA